jgi:hypothetical protein
MPIRVYLDHKDYVNIARGLRGEGQFESEVKAYSFLKHLVEKGDLICYFSATHLLEAVRYQTTDLRIIDSYCEVLDNLTKGRCIVWFQTLEERELAYYAAHHFGFSTTLSRETFPYGEYLDAFPGGLEAFSGWAQQFKHDLRRQMREAIKPYGKTRNDRRQLLKKVPKLSQFEFTPDLQDSIPLELQSIFTPELITEFIQGVPQARKETISKVMTRMMSFRQLLAFWRTTCPDIDRMGKVFDDSSKEMIATINSFRWLSRYLESEECKIDLREVRRSNTEKISKYFSKKVHQLLPDKGVTRRDIEEMLMQSDMKAMPSWDIPLSLYTEYLKDNMRSGKREVLESDIRDIIHFRGLPYVDYFVTDRYFAEIARRIKDRYQTTVLRNVGQLVMALSGRA